MTRVREDVSDRIVSPDIADADGEVVVEAYAKNARVPTSATLDSIRGERNVLQSVARGPSRIA